MSNCYTAGDGATHYIACECREAKFKSLELQLFEIRGLVDEQAKDEGLWYMPACTSEAYIQQEFRKLHVLIEKVTTGKGGNDE